VANTPLQYSPLPPMPCELELKFELTQAQKISSHTNSQNSKPIWLPHCPHLHVQNPARRNSLEARSTREKRGGDGFAAGDKQLGSCAAGKRKYSALCVHNCKLILAAMYIQRVRIDGRSYAGAPTQVSTVATPAVPAAQNLGVGLRRPCSADV
jgi:hypothetical protein